MPTSDALTASPYLSRVSPAGYWSSPQSLWITTIEHLRFPNTSNLRKCKKTRLLLELYLKRMS